MPDDTQVGSGAPTDQQPKLGNEANSTDASQRDESIANPEAKRYADEAAAHRKRVRELEAKLKEFEDSKLSDQQRIEKQLAELQQQHSEYQTASQQRILKALVRAEATDLGINPSLAARLVDLADIEFDDDGEPKNLRKLLKSAAEQFGLSAQPAKPAVSSGGATNPAKSAAANGPMSWDVVQELYRPENRAEYERRKPEVMAFLANNNNRR